MSLPPTTPHIDGRDQRDTRMPIDAALMPALFDNAHVAMLTVDDDGLITGVTPTAEALLGYLEGELLGESLHKRLHYQSTDGAALDAADCPILNALQRARPAHGDTEVFIRRDGTAVVVSWAVAPMVVAGTRTGGVISFYDVRAHLDVAGRQAERLARSEATNTRLTLLADVTKVLTEIRDLRTALADLLHVLVPVVADWAVLGLHDDQTGAFERVAFAHRDPVAEETGQRTLGVLGYLNSPAQGPLGNDEESVRFDDLGRPGDEGAHEAVTRARLGLFETYGSTDALTAPFRARGRTLGSLTLVRVDPQRPFGPEDVAFVSDLASRVAFAVDNAVLFRQQQRRAEQMQRALLPDLPADQPGLELAGAYYPASDVAQVGGDWYDAFNLSDGTVALVIGDVAGHDLHAATRMSAVRHKLRAIAGDRIAPPGQIVTRLDRVLQRFAPGDMVTLIYARLALQADGWLLEWTNAGHPPPLLLQPDGTSSLLTGEIDPPLGVSELTRSELSRTLSLGSTLVFFTDGLVEHRGESLDEGLGRLLTRSEGLRLSPAELNAELVERAKPTRDDDIALLTICLQSRAGA